MKLKSSSENKTKAAATHSAEKQVGTESTFQFADNRAEAVAQRKLQVIANNSSKVQQLATVQKMANPNADKTIQKKEQEEEEIRQHKMTAPIQKMENKTGLPDQLKSGVENLSGHAMDDVKVHYNSAKPAQLRAHAYAQGTNIHLGPGQEKHLPHEAWHVVQQKQGRVKPTMQMKGKVNINDDVHLEKEADVMGAKAMSSTNNSEAIFQKKSHLKETSSTMANIQRIKIGKQTIENIGALAGKLNINNEQIINYMKAEIPGFPVSPVLLDKFLSGRKTNIRKGNIAQPQDYCARLARAYKRDYWLHVQKGKSEEFDNMEGKQDFKDLDFDNDQGVDDGHEVQDAYNAQLACSLYAMLKLKNPFLGATTPEELHNVLRKNEKTKLYDEDKAVAKLRLLAGLKLKRVGDKSVNQFIGSDDAKTDKKYIIDPAGDAHTFVIEYENRAWKVYDNVRRGAALGNYGRQMIKNYWYT